jgi:hypothetical protein
MNLDEHINKLQSEYSIEIFEDKFIIVNRVPYLNQQLELRYGSVVAALEFNGDRIKESLDDHTIWFVGELPHKIDGKPFKPHNSDRKELFSNYFADHYFSYKKNGQLYPNYYEKMTHYVKLFSKHAIEQDPSATAIVGSLTIVPSNSPFKYPDCTARDPEVSRLLELFNEQKIGIIGLGGTGSYILDFVAKSPVKEIRIFDGDFYHNKNAFRSPGATSIDMLTKVRSKVEYFLNEYSKVHNSISGEQVNISSTTLGKLEGLSFVFIAIDKSAVKKDIVEYLEKHSIGFIDVGMGINVTNGAILGTLRTTTSTSDMRQHVYENKRIKFTENSENDYSKLVQIAELNALNAALAVVRWKKSLGFYHDRTCEHHSWYHVHTNSILNCDFRTGT